MPLGKWRQTSSGLVVPAGLYTGRIIVPQHGPTAIRQASRVETRRRRASKSHERVRRRIEARGTRMLLQFYARIIDDAARRVRRSGKNVDVDSVLAIDRYHVEFNALFLRWGFYTAAQGVAFERSWIRSAAPRSSRQWATSGLWVQAADDDLPDITVEMPDSMSRRIRGWLSKRANQAWRGVKKTLRKVIGKEIAEGLKDGDSMRELAARVRKNAPGKTKWQATLIARTESTAAMNHGQQAEREDAEILHKEWVSTLDSRTRSIADGDAFDHIAPDGQVVRNDEPFIVSGQKLMFPGDGSLGASAGNLCNCRCSSAASWPDDPLDTVHRPDPVPPAPAEIPPPPPPPPAPPSHITHTGRRTEFSEAVWKEIGDGVESEAHAIRVGRTVSERIIQDTAEFQRLVDEAEAEIADAAAELGAAKKTRDYIDAMDRHMAAVEKHKRAVRTRDVERGRRARLVLEEIRDVGGVEQTLVGDEALHASIREAERMLPSDWLKASRNRGSVNVVKSKTDRAHYDYRKNEVAITPGSGVDISVHELTHRMEHVVTTRTAGSRKFPGISELESEFKKRRVGKEVPTRIYPKKEGNNEVGYKDDFTDHYMGREYSEPYHEYHEIMTMGVQLLMEPGFKERPFWDDRDMVDFVLGVLAGV